MERIDIINLYFTGSTSLLGVYGIFYDIIDSKVYNIINLFIVLYLIYDIVEKNKQLYFLKYKVTKNKKENNEINSLNIDYDYDNYNKILRNKEVIIHHIIFLSSIILLCYLKLQYFHFLLIESSTFFNIAKKIR